MRRLPLPTAAVLAVLVLGACSRDEGASAGATASTASAAGERQAGAGGYWEMVGPLVAGSYAGNCTRTPESGTLSGAAITLGADGKLSAPGLDTDMRKSQLLMLTRESAGGAVKAGASMSLDPEKGPVLNIVDESRPEGAGAVILQGESMLHCDKGAPLEKLRAQPLHRLAAQALEVRGQSLKCVSLASMGSSTTTEFKLTNGVATLGSTSFDLGQATEESLMLNQVDQQMIYSFQLPGRPRMNVSYDGSGKVIQVQGRTDDGPGEACQVEA